MKYRINIRPVLSDPLHGVRIVLYILFFAVVLLPVQRELLQRAGWGHSFDAANPLFSLAPPPAILAGGIEVQEGIHQFNGKSARGVWSNQTTYILASILYTYLLGPALLAWGLRARSRWRQNLSGVPGVSWIAIAITMGGVSLVSIIPAPMYAVISNTTYRSMVYDSEISTMQDALCDQLFQMARRAQVIYFLPGEMGGGNQSWLARNASGNPVIDISRILVPTQSAGFEPEQSGPENRYSYSLHVDRTDSLTIRGVNAETKLRRADGTDENDHAVKVEVCIGVTPDRVNVVVMN